MKSQEEILIRIKEIKESGSFFDSQTGDLLGALTAESVGLVKDIISLKADYDISQHTPLYTTDDEVRARAIGYLPFAWNKANNCRGLSAMRSIDHYHAWLWLLGVEEVGGTALEQLHDYNFYGKDELIKIGSYFGQDSSQWDDDVRVNSEN